MLVRFRLRPTAPGAEPRATVISGGPETLGAWAPEQALRMQPGLDGAWEAVADVPQRFAYRFMLFAASDGTAAQGTRAGAPDETGLVRQADLADVAPGEDGLRQVDNHWQATSVRFVTHHRLPVGQRLAVVGSHPEIGDWQSPRPMQLGDERPLDTGGRGRCWEALVPFAAPVEDLAYRYVVLASEPRWEREPDRHVTVPPAEEVPNGLIETADRNVVTGLEVDWITRHVAVGPYPQTSEHVETLAESGVTALVNLQTDEDLRHRGVDLERLQASLRQRDIEPHRMPIRDFDEAELIQHLPAAADLLDRLARAGHGVYVHCTAGMGRAPAVILTYLSGQGHELSQARELLHRQHPASAPNVTAVRCAMERPA